MLRLKEEVLPMARSIFSAITSIATSQVGTLIISVLSILIAVASAYFAYSGIKASRTVAADALAAQRAAEQPLISAYMIISGPPSELNVTSSGKLLSVRVQIRSYIEFVRYRHGELAPQVYETIALPIYYWIEGDRSSGEAVATFRPGPATTWTPGSTLGALVRKPSPYEEVSIVSYLKITYKDVYGNAHVLYYKVGGVGEVGSEGAVQLPPINIDRTKEKLIGADKMQEEVGEYCFNQAARPATNLKSLLLAANHGALEETIRTVRRRPSQVYTDCA
jgi:hypothetical protein